MCGIAGFFNTPAHTIIETVENLEIRGRDGFGAVGWHPQNVIDIVRTLETPRVFLNKIGDADPLCLHPIVLANTRAVPTTEFQTGAGLDLKNQQPFYSPRFLWVFNGLIANDKELIQKYNLKTTASVDTAMLGPLFEAVGVIEGMKQLEGAYAIICFDRKEQKIYFGKNFLPLVMHWTPDDPVPIVTEGVSHESRLVIASLKEMLPLELRRSAKEVPTYTCFEFQLATRMLFEHSLQRKERNKKALVIFSSGIDSVVTAWLYKYLGYDLTLLHFTYGQAAQKCEEWAARKLAEQLNAKLLIQDAKPLFSMFKESSKLLRDTSNTAEVQINDAESTLSYVPNRNGIFAMLAAAVAEKEGCDTVTYGGQQMSASYPDNNIGFVNGVDQTLKYSLNQFTNVKFTAPFIHLIKHEIVKIGLALNVPYDLVCSCYYPKLEDEKLVVCGECGCCQFRFSAFKMLGIKDTQTYKTLPTPDWFTGLKEKLDWTKEDLDKFLNQYVVPFV